MMQARKHLTTRRRRGVPLVTLPNLEAPEYAKPLAGETIREFVDRTGWEARGLPLMAVERVQINGAWIERPILRARWDEKCRKANRRLLFVARPQGGGGGGGGSRQVGGIVAMIALAVIATMVAGPIGTALAGSGTFLGATAATWATIAKVLIVAGGTLLISHFLAPKSGAKDDKSGNDISLSGNRARPQQPIPVHYGKLKFNPDFGSQSYSTFTGTNGRDQIFYGDYVLGMGEFVVHEIGIADTPMWRAGEGVLTGFTGFQHEIVAPDQNLTLFPVNIVTAGEVSGQEFSTTNTYIGPFVINPAGTVGRKLFLDFAFPNGCYALLNGGTQSPNTQTVVVEYRYVDGAGAPIGGAGAAWSTALTTQLRYNALGPVRVTKEATIPTAGRIQVRAKITEPIRTSQKGTNALVWSGVRMEIEGPNARPKVTRLGVRIAADQTLSGYSSQNLYVIATRKIPVWDGASWVTQATQNPVWAYVDMWHNPDYGGGMERSRIDIVALSAAAAECDAQGYTFNHRFTNGLTVLDALSQIAAVIAAKPVILWDRLSIFLDRPVALPELLLTDFEIVRGSMEVVYPLQDDESADGTVVEYFDENVWNMSDAPSSATITELIHPARVQIPGLTKRSQAVWLARYLEQTNRLRRKMVTLSVEAEGKIMRYGMTLAVQSNMPGSWGQSAQVVSYDTTTRTLVLRTALDWEETGSHYIRVRRPNGKAWGPVLVTKGAQDNIAIVNAADLTTVEGQQGVTLAAAVARSSEADEATISFSPGQPVEFVGTLTRLNSSGGRTFRITLATYDEDVYDNTGPVPPATAVPPLTLPRFAGPVQGIYASLVQAGLALQLSAGWVKDPAADYYNAHISLDEGESWLPAYSGGYDPYFMAGGLPFVDVWLRVQGVTSTINGDMPGPWTNPVIITAPAIDATATFLGVTVQYTDLTLTARTAIENNAAAEAQEVRNELATARAEIEADFASADAVIASSVTSLTTTVNNNTAAISAETTARSNADTALSNSISTVSATTNSNTTAITNETTARTNADTALGSRIDSVESTAGANTAAITSEATTRANADSALSGRIDTVESTANGNTAAITSEATTRANADTALSNQITTVSSAASRQRVFRQTAAPTAGGVGDIWYDTDDNNRTYVWDGSAWQATDNAQIATNTAAITTEQTTRATQDTALANQITAVEATANDGTASGRVKFTALSGGGIVAAEFAAQVRATVGSAYTSAAFRLQAMNDGTSRAVIDAEQFYLRSSGGDDAPFAVVGGVTYIKQAKIKDADITTLKIANNAVIIPNSAMSLGGLSVANSTPVELQSITFTLPHDARVMIQATCYGLNSSGNNALFYYVFNVDGTDVDPALYQNVGAGAYNMICHVMFPLLSAGTHTIKWSSLRQSGTGTASMFNRTMFMQGVMR